MPEQNLEERKMHPSEFWTVDGNHSQPTLINDTTGRYRQERQRTNALRYVKSINGFVYLFGIIDTRALLK